MPDTFEINRERAIDYLNTRDNVYVFDGYAGVSPLRHSQLISTHRPNLQWDPKYRIRVRVICARAYHALFMVSVVIFTLPISPVRGISVP